jgi:hypothetical protein
MKKFNLVIMLFVLVSSLFVVTSYGATSQTSARPTCSLKVYKPSVGNPYAVFTINVPRAYRVTYNTPHMTTALQVQLHLEQPHKPFLAGNAVSLDDGWYGSKSVRIDSPVKILKSGDYFMGDVQFTAINGNLISLYKKKQF